MLRIVDGGKKPGSSLHAASRLACSLVGALFTLLLAIPSGAWACPDLSPFYSSDLLDWQRVAEELAGLMPQCLESSEYFAVYGAAQMHSGQLPAAMESLERALLIEPENGAAQIDYAQALYESGQLFSALELNEKLLQRTDLPTNLAPQLLSRQRSWREMTRQSTFHGRMLAGYADNLNGGPDSGQITLTPSGEPILLALSAELQPIAGPYLNIGLGNRFRQLAPEHQHNWTTEIRGRLSEDSSSDLVQLATQYAFIRPSSGSSWQLEAGLNHLLFGGSQLFTGIQTEARYQPRSRRACRPYYGLAIQHQQYHAQELLDGLESKAGIGFNCSAIATPGNQRLNAELSLLHNSALKNRRLGGDRAGWQFDLNWQYSMSRGVFSAQ